MRRTGFFSERIAVTFGGNDLNQEVLGEGLYTYEMRNPQKR
jgi:hypothetical protein